MSRYPFTWFPASWYCVASSEALVEDVVLSRRLCDRGLLLKRVVDAVEARWVDGTAADVREANGRVFVYFDADGGAPTFDVPQLPEHGSPEWGGWHRMAWRGAVHVQETAENAVDLAHFEALHKHEDVPDLECFDTDGPTFRVRFVARRKVLGRIVETTTNLHYFGLGLVVARVQTPVVNVVVMLTYTPLAEEDTDIVLSYMVERSNPLVDWVLPYFLSRDIRDDFHRDIPVWENKVYLPRPVLCADDGPIMRLRRWATQFYGRRMQAASQ